jgi:hypothetical protein
VAGTSPQVDAGITPDDQVQMGRVYFKSALGDAFFYVEGVGRDYAHTQAPEERAIVVEKREGCGDKPIAALGPADPVRVFSVSGGTALPPGFFGVSSVVAGAATGAAGAAAGAAAAGGGAFLTSTAGIIVLGAAAVGVGTVVIVSTTGGSDNPPPASPSTLGAYTMLVEFIERPSSRAWWVPT